MAVLLALLLIFSSTVLYWCYGIFKRNRMVKDIPGPPPIPFVGLKMPKDIYDVNTMFEDLFKTYGKICKIYIGDKLYVLTCDAVLIEELMKSNTHIRKTSAYDFLRPLLKDGLIVSYDKKWKERRRLCTPTLHFSMMKEFFVIFKHSADSIVETLGKAADSGSVIDAIDYTSKFALDVVGESSMGIKLDTLKGNNQEYVKATKTFTKIVTERHFSTWKRFDLLFQLFSNQYKIVEKAITLLNNTAMKVIENRRAYYKQNPVNRLESLTEHGYKKKCILIDALLQYKDLSDVDIQEEVNNFLFAGHDTTSAGLAFTLLELSTRPDIQEKLYEEINSYVGDDIKNLTQENLQEMRYLDMVVKEMLRLRTPVPFIERVLEEDAVLAGKLYPKGTSICILIYSMHHHSDYYQDPEKLDPERFNPSRQSERSPFAFIPFSAGPRNCIGQKYALMEMKLVIARIIKEFIIQSTKDFKLVIGFASILRSKNGFPIKLTRRNNVKT